MRAGSVSETPNQRRRTRLLKVSGSALVWVRSHSISRERSQEPSEQNAPNETPPTSASWSRKPNGHSQYHIAIPKSDETPSTAIACKKSFPNAIRLILLIYRSIEDCVA